MELLEGVRQGGEAQRAFSRKETSHDFSFVSLALLGPRIAIGTADH